MVHFKREAAILLIISVFFCLVKIIIELNNVTG